MQRIIYNLIFLSTLLLFASCGNNEVENNQAQEKREMTTENQIFVSRAQFKDSGMALGTLEERPFPLMIQTTGIIDVPPENRAVVNATMGGYIVTAPLLIGDQVRKGQALVTIENPDFVTLQQTYMEVHEQLAFLKSEYERQKTMMTEKITSQKSFLQAESAYKTAKARHSGLQKQLQMLNILPSRVEAGNITSIVTIYAPIAGSITKVNVTRGTYVSPATAILEIIDNEHIHLELAVFEKDIMMLEKGQRIDFRIPESSEEMYKAEVHLIGSAIEDNRTIKVHGHIQNESEANFLTGMFVEASIITETAYAKALPETALVAIDDTFYGLKLFNETSEGYYFELIKINVENNHQGFLSIEDPEALEGLKFLTKGAFHLINDL